MPEINIDVSSAIPLFADQIAIATRFAVNKDKKGEITKQATIEFLFVDTMTKKTVVRVDVPLCIAKVFGEGFIETLKKAEEDLKSKEIPKQQDKIVLPEGKSYFG